LELLAGRGLVGLSCFVGAIYGAGSMLKASRTRCNDPLWVAVSASLVLILVGGLTELSLLRYWFSQLLLVVLAMVFVLDDVGGKRDEEKT
jgi:hypothetical protein